MTNAEAIETLRANYPDACFEQLRCAVDMAINALTKEAWKEEHPVSPLLQKLATNLQSSKQDADDTISRAAAIDALDKHLRTTDVPVSYPGIISALTEWLNELPSAQADIIRCKDCIKQPLCKFSQYQGNDGYCSLAERRTDE